MRAQPFLERRPTPEPPTIAASPPSGLPGAGERVVVPATSPTPASLASSELAVSEPGDAAEREAEQVADLVMGMDLSPVHGAPPPSPGRGGPASAVARQAEVVAARPPAASHGASHGASAAVDAGLRAGGRALDAETRAFFEPRFGHDFSQVRVHTDADASRSAEQLQARAYTVGNDIAFRGDAYAPQTSGGQRLLAHELAHVVQQSSGMGVGSAARLVQRAAEIVRKPGWGSTLAGDDSNIWFNPHADLHTGRAPAQAMAQSTWFPRAASGGREETLTVPAGAREGSVSFYVDFGWYKDNMVDDETGRGQILAVAPFRVTPEGSLAWEPVRPGVSGGGRGAQLMVPVEKSAAGNSFVVTPAIDGMGSSSSSSGSSVSVEGTGVNAGSSTTSPAGVRESRAYSVVLDVARSTEPITIPTTSFYTRVVTFAPGEDRIVDDTQGSIAMWFLALPDPVKSSVASGATQIELEGYASTTRDFEFNQDLSERRARRAQRILQGPASTDARFKVSWFGKAAARVAGEPDNLETVENRRTVISIAYAEPSAPAAPAAPAAGHP